ncbi:MAG: hypothetical protein RIS35_2024 [Pseudomonadota bacterium]
MKSRSPGLATLLRWLWFGQLRSNPGRALTAVVAIAIGVALGLGIHLINRSALDEFDAALAVINAQAQARVVATAGSFDEAAYPSVAMHPAIAAASPVLETEVLVIAPAGAQSGTRRPPKLQILGLDVMRAAQVSPSLLPMADGDAPAGSASDVFADDAIFLSPAARRGLDVATGERITVRAGPHEATLRVAGSVPGAAAGQWIAVMDLGAAQWRLGWLGRLTRIDLKLAPGVSAGSAPPDLLARLPRELAWSTPDTSRQRMSNLSRAYRVNLSVLALVALFTGGFIVHSTVALGVLRQQQTLALLGVLGATRRTLVLNVVGQGAILGAIGAGLGTAAGIGLAHATLGLVGGDLGGGYFQGSTPSLSIDLPAIVAFALLGIAAAVSGSLPPALSLRRIAPAQALRSGTAERLLRGRESALLAAGLGAAGAALAMAPPIGGLPIPAYLAIALWLLAGIAFVPIVTHALGRALTRPGLGTWRLPPAWLAAQRLRGASGSAAAALAGVVASVALASAMAIMVHSFRVSVDRWLGTVLPADLYGRSHDGGRQGLFGPDLQRRLQSAPGVARAEFLRVLELRFDPARPPVALLARTLDDVDVRQRLPVTGEVLTPPGDRVAIHVSEAMADLYGFTPGREVDLPLPMTATQHPPPRFFVASIWRDYARQHGAIVIDSTIYRRLTGDDSFSDVSIWLGDGARADGVIDAIHRTLPELEQVEFRSTQEIRALSLTIFDRSFAVTYVLEAVAILVGLFGVAATYSGEALARAREFGMLRHLGVTRGQISRMFAVEAGALIGAGVAWGGVIGVAIAMLLVHRVNPQSFHWTMDVAWPWSLLGACAAALVLLGLVVAVVASRAATGADPVRAVRSDW